ncbi:MAG: transcription termination/antitermination NusG family protein [Candidatus Promineifilaceae bacterium]|nr:transcription termination/antitermination NusG family protein [Candidatus Promineifilaceae bacterium]
MVPEWYVLRTKPHKERSVYQLLKSRDFDVYFPSIEVEPVNPRAARVRPFFPGYMFVRLDLDEQGENVLRWMPGTNGLVRFGGEPATVPESLIGELKKRLKQLAEAPPPREDLPQKGDRVRIISGPFAGYEAIFDTRLSGRDRVQVLMTFLSHRPQRLRLDESDIEKVE